MFEVRKKATNFKPGNKGKAKVFFLELEREFFVFFLFNKNKLQLSFPSNSVLKLNLLLDLFEGNNILNNREYIEQCFPFTKQADYPMQIAFFYRLNSLELHHLFTKEHTMEEKDTVVQCKE